MGREGGGQACRPLLLLAPGTTEKREGSQEPHSSPLQAGDPLLTFRSTFGPGTQDPSPEPATLGPRPSPRINHDGAQHPCSWGVRREACFPARTSLNALPPAFLGPQSHPGRESPIADPGAGGEGTGLWTKAPAGATHRASAEGFVSRPTPAG